MVVFLYDECDGFVEVIIGNDNLVCLSVGLLFLFIDDVFVMWVFGFSFYSDGFIIDECSG